MNTPRTTCAVLIALALFASTRPVLAASPSGGAGGTSQLDKDSRDTLNELNKLLNEDIDNTRETCASGEAPQWVSAKRARYGPGKPFADAADMCVATLGSIAHRQRLMGYYRAVLTRAGGDPALFAAFPRSIGAAVVNGSGKVAIGNGKAATVPAALAFDAGFTSGYEDGATAKVQPPVNRQQLKAVTEACLGQHSDAGTCFSVGYVQGVASFREGGAPPR